MGFHIGDDVVINDSTIDPGKDTNGSDKDVNIGDGTVISGSAIGNGAEKR